MRKYPGLDLLKVYLMFSIAFCFHYKNLLLDATLPYPFYSILHYGYDYGGWFVILFFSISGFLAQSQRQRIEKESMCGFLGRKILHLYPMMWLSVFVGAAGQWMTLFTGGGGGVSIADGYNLSNIVLSLLGIQDGWIGQCGANGVTWQIAILMICYAIYHKLIKNNGKKHIEHFSLLVLIGAYLSLREIDFPLLYRRCGFGYFGFFMGCLLYDLCELLRQRGRQKTAASLGWILTVGYFLVFEAMPGTTWGRDAESILFVLNPGVILLCTQSRVVSWISNCPVVRYLSKLSYPVYLFHIPVMVWSACLVSIRKIPIDYRDTKTWLMYLAAVTLCSIIAAWLNQSFSPLLTAKVKGCLTDGEKKKDAGI